MIKVTNKHPKLFLCSWILQKQNITYFGSTVFRDTDMDDKHFGFIIQLSYLRPFEMCWFTRSLKSADSGMIDSHV